VSGNPRRGRSTRYPGVDLAEGLKFAASIESLGVDGLDAASIASALGYSNIKTNTFSARLSAARQFGLLSLTAKGYTVTPLARAILHPVDPADRPRLLRQLLLKPPLYAELAVRFAGKRVPDVEVLGNVLYHNHQITATAKHSAAEAFLASARYAGALGDDLVFHPDGPEPIVEPAVEPALTRPAGPRRRESGSAVRIDLALWDQDEGKTIRVRAPRSISAASFERFLQAFRLHVKIEEGQKPGR
jgi:hypothetical protein